MASGRIPSRGGRIRAEAAASGGGRGVEANRARRMRGAPARGGGGARRAVAHRGAAGRREARTAGSGLPRRRDEAAVDGLGGPVMGLAVFSFFYFFISFTEAGMKTASVNVTINHDVGSEVVAKIASVNAFCPHR